MSLHLHDTVCLRHAGSARFVSLGELVTVSAQDNYTEVTLADGGRMIVRRTLKSWEDVLPTPQFFRVHRTLIVNLARVVRCERTPDERTWLYLDSIALPVAASRRAWSQLRVSLASLHHGF